MGVEVVCMAEENKPVILIVDDEPLVLELERRALMSEGFDVREARNGQEAVDAVYNSRPSLILMDLMMPVMDGYTACRRYAKATTYPLFLSLPWAALKTWPEAWRPGLMIM